LTPKHGGLYSLNGKRNIVFFKEATKNILQEIGFTDFLIGDRESEPRKKFV
jgi:hypothetical protein